MQRGFSLVEVLIVAAVMTLFFGGLFVAIQSSLKLVADSRARTSALSLINDQIEYIRSLSYNAAGTVSGIPSGLVPQVSTSTLNGIVFTRRTLIEYVDDPADGVGAADSNSITTDYKQIKVEVSWSLYGTSESAFLVTNIVPRSIETDVGGGTIRVYVYDAAIAPVSGASVRLVNTSGTTSVDVTRSTDATGIALFGGAPASSGYEVFVSKAGFSSDQTYVATGTLANPVSQPFTVAEADVTTVNFFIDETSDVQLRFLTDYVPGTDVYTFATTSDVLQSTSTAVSGDSLVLTNTAGVYSSTGSALLAVTAPTPLARWDAVAVQQTASAGTTWRMRIYSGTTTDTLIPDSDLPGNTAGFVDEVDLSRLDTGVYASLYVGLELSTTNSAVTPVIDEVTVYYRESETALVSTAFTVLGSKIIGTDSGLQPVYKTTLSTSTNSSGERVVSNMEWDSYQLSISGYDIAESCLGNPLTVPPGDVLLSEYVAVPNSLETLLVTVVDSSGNPIRGATVRLERGGNTQKITQRCGQVFFESLVAAIDYRLEVSAPGYGTITVDPVSVSGDTKQTITL